MIVTRSQGRGDGTQRRATRRYSELNCCSQLRKVMATTDFLLNCFVLGDNENNVFSVEIAKNKNVSILKDEIKKKKVHLLNHVDASDLELWKVSFPIDGHPYKKPQPTPSLRPSKRLFTLWDGEPSDDDLHILVKAPGTSQEFLFLISTNTFKSGPVDPMQLLPLNCFVLGRVWKEVFTVKIPKTENVSVLKKMIKEENAHLLNHVDASDLELCQVSLLVDDKLEDAVKEFHERYLPVQVVCPISKSILASSATTPSFHPCLFFLCKSSSVLAVHFLSVNSRSPLFLRLVGG